MARIWQRPLTVAAIVVAAASISLSPVMPTVSATAASATGPSPTPTASPSATSTPDPGPQAEMIYTVGQTPVIPGADEVWTIAITNVGDATTTDPVGITFTYDTGSNPELPGIKQAFSHAQVLSPNARDCTVSSRGPNVTCDFTRFAPGQSTTIAIAALLDFKPSADVGVGFEGDLYAGIVAQGSYELQFGVTSISPAPTGASDVGSLLDSGDAWLYAGMSLASANGQYRLDMQNDGNLVEYGDGRALWSSGTAGHVGAYAVMQDDGDFVLEDYAGTPLWSTRSAVAPGAFGIALGLSNTGVLSVTRNGSVGWSVAPPNRSSLLAPATLSEGQAITMDSDRLVLQSDGNFVDYVAGKAVWASGTTGRPGDRVTLQKDGNLVVYSSAGKALWSSRTNGSGSGDVLTLRASGALVLTHGSKVVWHVG